LRLCLHFASLVTARPCLVPAEKQNNTRLTSLRSLFTVNNCTTK
jgi:hypothetical protein